MSKILILSDTHYCVEKARSALSYHPSADVVVHLGDGISDLMRIDGLESKALVTVRGNNDIFENDVPYETVLDIDGYRILLCHGHKYFVKSSLAPLYTHASELHCDIALFGHTHTRCCEYRDGIYLFNPGSASYSAYPHASYGILETAKNGIYLSHGDL